MCGPFSAFELQFLPVVPVTTIEGLNKQNGFWTQSPARQDRREMCNDLVSHGGHWLLNDLICIDCS